MNFLIAKKRYSIELNTKLEFKTVICDNETNARYVKFIIDIIPHLEDNYFGKTDIYDNVIFSKDDLDKVESCIGKYAASVVIAYVFLVIFIFLYFIILNLYKGACCDMFTICKKTNDCFNNFGGCMRDNFYCILHCGKGENIEIEHLKDKTIIIISHRFNNKKLFDRVLKLENGVIYEGQKL